MEKNISIIKEMRAVREAAFELDKKMMGLVKEIVANGREANVTNTFVLNNPLVYRYALEIENGEGVEVLDIREVRDIPELQAIAVRYIPTNYADTLYDWMLFLSDGKDRSVLRCLVSNILNDGGKSGKIVSENKKSAIVSEDELSK